MRNSDDLLLQTRELSTLPAELILNIFKFLDERSLAIVSKTCKLFYEMIKSELGNEKSLLSELAPHLHELQRNSSQNATLRKSIRQVVFNSWSTQEKQDLEKIKIEIETELNLLGADLMDLKKELETFRVWPTFLEFCKFYPKLSMTTLASILAWFAYTPVAIPKMIGLTNEMNQNAAAAANTKAASFDIDNQSGVPDYCMQPPEVPEDQYEICQKNLNAYFANQGLLAAWMTPDIVSGVNWLVWVGIMIHKYFSFDPIYSEYPAKFMDKKHAEKWKLISVKYPELKNTAIKQVQDIINAIDQFLTNQATTFKLNLEGNKLLADLKELLTAIEQDSSAFRFSLQSAGNLSKLSFHNNVNAFFKQCAELKKPKAEIEIKEEIKNKEEIILPMELAESDVVTEDKKPADETTYLLM